MRLIAINLCTALIKSKQYVEISDQICKHKNICAYKHNHVGLPSKPAILICHTDEVTPLPVSVSLQSYFLSNLRQGRQFQGNIILWSKRNSKSHWDQHKHTTATDESSLCKQAYVIMIDEGLQVGWQIWMTATAMLYSSFTHWLQTHIWTRQIPAERNMWNVNHQLSLNQGSRNCKAQLICLQ